jgi:hypothetical protein
MEVGGRLVSAVHVVRREAYTKEGTIGVGGIANVATHPDFRGKGYNSACLNAMIAHLEADPFFEISLLGTGIHEYYEKFGWQRWPIPVQKFMSKPLAQTAEIVPATTSDLPKIKAIHAAYNQSQPLIFCRNSKNYWEDWLQWTPENFYLTPSKDTYAKVIHKKTNSDHTLFIFEELGGSVDGIESLFTNIIAKDYQENGTYVVHSALLPPELNQLVAHIGENISQDVTSGWMVRAHKSKTLLDLTYGFFYGTDGF